MSHINKQLFSVGPQSDLSLYEAKSHSFDKLIWDKESVMPRIKGLLSCEGSPQETFQGLLNRR